MDSEPRTTLEEKRQAPTEAERALVRTLRGRAGRVTLADAVTASGLPTHIAEPALERLLKRYRSHLAVTETGELLYTFDPSFHRRDQPTLGERARAAGQALARVGVRAFQLLIAVTLVVYVIVFVILILGVLFGGKRDDRRGGDWGGGGGWGGHGHGHGGGGMGWVWWFLWPRGGWGWGTGHHDAWGRPLPGPAPRRGLGRGGAPRKSLVASVNDFVFGPARPRPDPLEDEREVLAYIRAREGRVTATDLVSLFGWSYARAEEEATRLLVDYDGEPEISEGGVLVYAFPKMLRSAGAASSGSWRQAWERLEERPSLTSNRGATNWLIGGFASFNLIVSMNAADWAAMSYGLEGAGWDVALTWFPLGFFGLFLSIPAARALARRLGDRGREQRNRRRVLVRRALETRGGPLPDGPDMKDLALALEGEPALGAGAQVEWRFPRVAEELAERERHLAGVDVGRERQVGPVIFDSEDEPRLPGGDDDGRPRGPRGRLPS